MRRFEIVDNLGQMTQVSLLGLLKNTAIDARAWAVEVPSDADPMTLDELRSIAPLADRK